jgi:hypothetical protein
MNQPEKLVIFDYSGTLSIEAPQFGRPANLVRAFAESGLLPLGVTTPEIFWEEIVVPTWREGSTTVRGYKQVLAERIAALGLAPGATGAEIAAASSRFVDSYLDHSRIDPHWRPILEKLSVYPRTTLVIATDHYAEATETIVRYLHAWQITARKADPWAGSFVHAGDGDGTPLGTGRGNGGMASGFPRGSCKFSPSPFFIANSADIGFRKADRRFWEVLKSLLPLKTIRSALIIDDFGFNEERGDSDGEWAGVAVRQKKTLAALEELFHAVQVIPFFLKGGEREGAPALRIAETGTRISDFLGDIGEKI